MSVGAVLASSMVNASAHAYIDYQPLPTDYTTQSAPAQLQPGDRVKVDSAHVYQYLGAVTATPNLADGTQHYATSANWQQLNIVLADGAVTITAQDASGIASDTAMYGEVSPTNDAGAGILNSWAGSVLDEYKFTSKSGTQSLKFGDLVRVAD